MIDKLTDSTSARALLFALVVVVSMVGGPIAGTAAAAETVQANGTYWQGQVLTHDVSTAESSTVTLRVDGGENDGDFVQQYQVPSDGTLEVDTGELNLKGGYALHYDTNDTDTTVEQVIAFEVVQQTLSVSTEDGDSTVTNADTGANTVKFNLDSNRASTYTILVTENKSGDDLTAKQVAEIFGGTESDLVDGSDDDSEAESFPITVSTSDGSISKTGSFSKVDTGDYTFNFDVKNTTASATQKITVKKGGDAKANFDQVTYTSEQVGDKLVFTVNTKNTDQFTVNFGDEKQDGYNVTATVQVDNKSDSSVKLVFNTYKAGGNNAQPLSVHKDSSDVATITSQSDDTDLSDPLAASDYELEAIINGETKDIASAILQDRSTGATTTYTAPNTVTFSDLKDIKKSKKITQMNKVAMKDKVIFKVEASGLYGYVDSSTTAADLAKGSTFAKNHGVYVDITETDPEPNSAADTLDVSKGTLITDPASNAFYLVYDESDFSSAVKADDTFKTTFHVTEANPYVKSSTSGDANEQTTSSTFTVVERTTEFLNKTDKKGVVEVPAQKEATISAKTTVAPGTEVTVYARSDASKYPFLKTQTVNVTDDQKITATFNFSDATPGQEFTVRVKNHTKSVNAVFVSGGPVTYDVKFNVTNSAGEPVNANLSVGDKTATSKNGSVTMKLQAGDHTVTATAEGHSDLSKSFSVAKDGDHTVNLTMQKNHTITVNVTNSAGEAVKGADVMVDGTTKTTSADGTATFTVTNGDYTVEVTADGYQKTTKSVTVDGSDKTVSVSLSEIPTHTYTFKVTNDSGEPVENATVKVNGKTATTNAQGEATLNLKSGDYTTTITANGETKTTSITVSDQNNSSTVTVPASDSSNSSNNGGSGGIGTVGIVVLVVAILLGAGVIYWREQQ